MEKISPQTQDTPQVPEPHSDPTGKPGYETKLGPRHPPGKGSEPKLGPKTPTGKPGSEPKLGSSKALTLTESLRRLSLGESDWFKRNFWRVLAVGVVIFSVSLGVYLYVKLKN